MPKYQCLSCGKRFDPEKNDICPRCGAAVAPSVTTRIERKQTAQRMRAEGQFHYDEHCHEDDPWKGSYGAETHRAAVRAHEAELRAGYAAHRPADDRKRVSAAAMSGASGAQSWKRQSSSSFRPREHPLLLAVITFLAPALLFLVYLIVGFLVKFLTALGGSFGPAFP